jgi:hypothetical protein
MPGQPLHAPEKTMPLAGYMKWVFPFLRYFFHKIKDVFYTHKWLRDEIRDDKQRRLIMILLLYIGHNLNFMGSTFLSRKFFVWSQRLSMTSSLDGIIGFCRCLKLSRRFLFNF